jgi:hypothetical protein
MRDSKLTASFRTLMKLTIISFNAIAFYLELADMLAKEGL